MDSEAIINVKPARKCCRHVNMCKYVRVSVCLRLAVCQQFQTNIMESPLCYMRFFIPILLRALSAWYTTTTAIGRSHKYLSSCSALSTSHKVFVCRKYYHNSLLPTPVAPLAVAVTARRSKAFEQQALLQFGRSVSLVLCLTQI